ncbi:MAG TPA: hypothetical protein VMF51_18050 [Nocardioides sp.]|uniref:hypothetical protein n=1 Tax=Nocardioides sp. TaxID=35761 RepID=UPI002D11FD49|nr:hypothetical protein [Nocardioides sp.]HTW17038.1 hypothetical protein [Nocardioides sp.]
MTESRVIPGLGDAGAGLQLGQVPDAERRRAAVSVAEAAIAGGWQDELLDMLEHLGLDQVSPG